MARELLKSLFDYAGTFPPASLDTDAAIRNYARYLEGPYAWMLGRLILPVDRLDKCPDGPWCISAISSDPARDLGRIREFNGRGQAKVESIETGRWPVERPEGFELYCEVPLHEASPMRFRELVEAGARVKMRAGGITPEVIPEPGEIARFIAACAGAGAAFKATAGLHHPLRSLRPLTYRPDSVRGVMHGFLNVFIAAALVYFGMDAATAELVVKDVSPAAFRFGAEGVGWREHRLDRAQIARARTNFALSIGTCSFDEPVEGLKALGIL